MKTIIQTESAPAPIGPYNQATMIHGVLYTSGQIAIDPKSNALVTTDIQGETRLVLENLKAVVEAAGLGLKDVVKCSIFIADMEQFAEINAVYAEYFEEATAPARETVQVACLPKNVNIEISAIAVKP